MTSRKSPTINQIKDKMKEIKDKINKDEDDNKLSSYVIFSLLLYPFICLIYLLYFKPPVCYKNVNNKKEISYSKFILIYIIMLFPLICFLLLRFL